MAPAAQNPAALESAMGSDQQQQLERPAVAAAPPSSSDKRAPIPPSTTERPAQPSTPPSPLEFVAASPAPSSAAVPTSVSAASNILGQTEAQNAHHLYVAVRLPPSQTSGPFLAIHNKVAQIFELVRLRLLTNAYVERLRQIVRNIFLMLGAAGPKFLGNPSCKCVFE